MLNSSEPKSKKKEHFKLNGKSDIVTPRAPVEAARNYKDLIIFNY